MSGIYVATMLLIEVKTPVVPIFTPELFQIVDIAPLGMKNLTEQSLLRHVESVKLKEIIHAVLQHHAMLARFLGSVYESPDLIERSCGGHLDSHVFAILH